MIGHGDWASLSLQASWLLRWRRVYTVILRNRPLTAGLSLILALLLLTLGASWLAPHDPYAVTPALALRPPSPSHLLGTDQFGRDVLSRVLHGARLSLPLGLLSVTIALLVGLPLGLLAGYREGWAGALVMRLADVLLAFPLLLLALFLAAMLGRGLSNVMWAVALVTAPTFIRLTYGQTRVLRVSEHILAARAVGASDSRIVLRHVLPVILGPVLALAPLGVAWAILALASLSFLGLGPPPGAPEWGAMVNAGRDYLRSHWWISTFPGLAIALSVLACNLVAEGLRVAMDPRLM